MSDAFGFGKLVPGFEFLQNLAQSASAGTGAGTAVPGVSQWIAPTLSIEDVDKRIQELKSVLFWLEQNSSALKATIQALEVQKMTLSTLQGMNVNMAELARAFTAGPAERAATPATPAAAPEPEVPAEPAAQVRPDAGRKKGASRASPHTADHPASGPQAAAAVDPMQWWGSLTQQFQGIAASALKDVAAQAMNAPQSTVPAPASGAGKASGPSSSRRKGKSPSPDSVKAVRRPPQPVTPRSKSARRT